VVSYWISVYRSLLCGSCLLRGLRVSVVHVPVTVIGGATTETQRGKAATGAMVSSYTSGPDDHAGRRAAVALTRRERGEGDKESVSEFARSLRAI
jgi:hypothetical protein